ncbi:hypothetical protein OWR28_12595 [Chryseobacterium sp. 1B4]
MKTKTFFLVALALYGSSLAQVGINTPIPTQTLDVNGLVRVRGLSNAEKNCCSGFGRSFVSYFS